MLMHEAIQLKRKARIRTDQSTPERDNKRNKSGTTRVIANQRGLDHPEEDVVLDSLQVPSVIGPGGPGELEGTQYSWTPE
eukprot:30424-Heterocapsa_arctica.AAC.1